MKILFCLSLFLVSEFCLAQEIVKGAQNCFYNPSINSDGLSHVDVKVTYELFIRSGEVILRYNAECKGNLEVQYKGKKYTGYGGDRNTQDALPEISDVVCNNPVISMRVMGPGVNELYEPSVASYSLANEIRVLTHTPKDKLKGFQVMVNTGVLSMTFDQIDKVFAKIADREFQLANKRKYEEYLKDADRQIASGNFAEARKALRNAGTYANGDTRAAEKLREVEEKEKLANNNTRYEQLLKEADQKMAAKDFKGAKQTLETAQALAPPGDKRAYDKILQADKAESNIVTTEKDKSTGGGNEVTTKTPEKKTSPNDTDFWGEKKTTTKAPDSPPQKTAQQVADETRKVLEDKDRQFWAEKEALERKLARDGSLSTQSYYAAERLSNARSEVKAYSHLSGNHKTLEELEAEFEAKISQIRSKISEETEAKNEKLKADANYLWRDGNANDKAFGELAVGLGTIINGIGEEKRKREAREQLEREKEKYRQKMEEEIQAQKKALLLQIRNEFLSNFPDGGVPLSSHKVSTEELFFFSYIFDIKTIEAPNPVIYLTNIFPVNRYGDGTWPFKNNIVSEIRKKVQDGTVTMIGYYASQTTATETRNSFLSMASKGSFVIKDISYKGKVSSGIGATNNYWDNNSKPGNTSNVKDFWSMEKTASDSIQQKKPVKGFWD